MKILHTLHWVQFAGTEKVCVDLCNEMSRHHEVFLLTSEKIRPYITDAVNLVKFDFERNRYNPLFLYKTAQILKQISPDVIHCHNTKELEIMHHAQIFLRKKIPLVVTRHNAEMKKKNAYADLGVAVSSETMSYMNAKRNILITNGVSEKNANFIHNQTDNFTILAVGRLAPVKGFDLLLRALSLLKFDYTLIVLGEGNELENLTNLARNLGIDKRIEFKGFVNNVADYVKSCDMQVIASQTEGLSISLIEAIFYAPVLIASDVSNHSEILGKELVFDRNEQILAQKITEIYENRDKFIEIFAKVKAKKDEFSIEKMVEKYIQAYKSVIK